MKLLAVLLALTFAFASFNSDAQATSQNPEFEEVAENIRNANPQFANARILIIRNLSEYGLDDMYEANLGGQEMIVSRSGQYAILGDLFDLTSITNLTAEQRTSRMSEVAAEEIATLTNDQVVSFEAEGREVGTMWVFTDPTCPYCRRVHEEIEEYAAAGITVNYVPYPRSGFRGNDYEQLKKVMCADNRQQAMHDFKMGTAGSDYDRFGSEQKCHDIVANGYEMGGRIGITGTPFIFLSNGTAIPGYNPAERIIQLFN